MKIKTYRNKFQPERIKTLVINCVDEGGDVYDDYYVSFGIGHGGMNTDQYSLMNYMKREFESAYGYHFDKQTDVVDHFSKSGFYFIDLMIHGGEYDDDEYDDAEYEKLLKLKQSAELHDNIPNIADRIKQLKPATIAIVSDKIELHVRLAVDLSGCGAEIYMLPRLGIWPDNFVEKFQEDLLLIKEDRGVGECEQYIQHRFFDTLIKGGSDLQRKDDRYGRMMIAAQRDEYKKYELTSSEKFKQHSYEIYFDSVYHRKEAVKQKGKRRKLFRAFNSGEISETEYRNKMAYLCQPCKKKYWIFGGVKDGDG